MKCREGECRGASRDQSSWQGPRGASPAKALSSLLLLLGAVMLSCLHDVAPPSVGLRLRYAVRLQLLIDVLLPLRLFSRYVLLPLSSCCALALAAHCFAPFAGLWILGLCYFLFGRTGTLPPAWVLAWAWVQVAALPISFL